MYHKLTKRGVDVLGATAGLLILAIPMLVIALIVRIQMGSPVLYTMVRSGLRGKAFRIYKFRTMRDLRDTTGTLLPDRERITPLGRFLRRTSLDELPELFNVLRGEMSLVGPRPLLMDYLERYTAEQARRHEVKPGITGLAQISGRNVLPWEERFALDVWYVDNATLWTDLKILAQTVLAVIRRDSVSAEGDLDVPAFLGSASGS